MAKKLNSVGVKNAKARIKAGDFEAKASWSFGATDGNKILGDPPDWKRYAKWHLAIDPDANEETKAAYGYPFGKNGKVYRSGLNAVRQRAGQQNQDDIFEAAGSLRDLIDEKTQKESKKKVSEAERSLGQIDDLIWNAVRAEFGDWEYACTRDILPSEGDVNQGKVIVHMIKKDKHFRVSYQLDDNDNVTFGDDKTEVKLEKEWVGVSEAALTSFGSYTCTEANLIEAEGDEPEGKVWEVVIIKAGMSANDTNYPTEVLAAAAHKFEGVRALARSEEAHLRDSPRSVKDVVGWFTEVEFKGQRIIAKFRFAASEVADNIRKTVLDAWKQGKKDIMGFSIVAEGLATRKKRGDRIITHVESIERVFTTDIVLNPAAGGKFLKLVASQDKSHLQEVERMDRLLKLLESKAPGLYKKLDLENITEEKILELLAEALEGATEKEDKEKFTTVLTETKAMIKELAAERKKAEAKEKTASEEKGVKELLAEAKKERQLGACERILHAKLAECGLPKLATDRLQERFAETVFEVDALEKVIAGERDYLAKLSETGKVEGLGDTVKMGKTAAEKIQAGLDGFFLNKDVKLGEETIPRFRSFKEAYIAVTGDNKLRGLLTEASNGRLQHFQGLIRFTESLQTSSWAQILGDSVTRAMLAEYQSPNYQLWRNIVSDITAPTDFRTNRRLRFGGYGELPGVSEAGAYTALSSPGDEEATYAITKKGGTEDITLEMIANDDVGSIRRIPGRLAKAAGITLYRAVFDLIKDNGTIYDGDALAHANHNNLGATALDATTLLAGKKAMNDQTAFGDSIDILGLNPKHLLVPYGLEDIAFRLTKWATLIGATNNAGTEPNLHSTYGLEMMILPYWTDPNDWALVADPSVIPTIEVGFFNGQEEPELFVQDMPNVGSMFSNDKITYKIRHIYGLAVLDYRGFYKAVVT